MANIEIKVNTPEESFLKSIDFNHEEVKQELEIVLEKYQGLVFTDETMKEAKNTRSHLNSLKTKFEEVRKNMKRKCLEPYSIFEEKMKELNALIDKPILAIDTQIKAFDEKKKQEKLADIKAYWNDTAKDILDLVSFEKIFNDKWLNATTSIKSIQEEISKLVDDVKVSLNTISSLHTEYELQVKDKYLETLNLPVALAENTRLKERAEMLEKAKIVQAQVQIKEPEKKQLDIVEEVAKKEEMDIYDICFRVSATREQLKQLKEFFTVNNIKFERI